jgi:hypothetical protein
MTCAFKCINLIPSMLIWAMLDCKYKLDQIGQIAQVGRSRREEMSDKSTIQTTELGHPGDWMRLQVTAPLGENSRIQIKKDPVNWMMIQSTGW